MHLRRMPSEIGKCKGRGLKEEDPMCLRPHQVPYTALGTCRNTYVSGGYPTDTVQVCRTGLGAPRGTWAVFCVGNPPTGAVRRHVEAPMPVTTSTRRS